jgi:hypothetical protein
MKQKKFMTSKPGLQKILEGILHREEEDKCNYKNTERINITRCIDKQMKSKKGSNSTKTPKWQELIHIFQ